MSKTKDTISGEVEDLAFEHSQHLVYESKCSECYKKAPEVKQDEEGNIVLTDKQEEYSEDDKADFMVGVDDEEKEEGDYINNDPQN